MRSQDPAEKCEMDNLGPGKPASSSSKITSSTAATDTKPCPHWAVMSSLHPPSTQRSSRLDTRGGSKFGQVPPPSLSVSHTLPLSTFPFLILSPYILISSLTSNNRLIQQIRLMKKTATDACINEDIWKQHRYDLAVLIFTGTERIFTEWTTPTYHITLKKLPRKSFSL